jgi:hypothetical protein
MLPHEHAGCAGMVEVDVRQQQMPQILELEPMFAQRGLQLWNAR